MKEQSVQRDAERNQEDLWYHDTMIDSLRARFCAEFPGASAEEIVITGSKQPKFNKLSFQYRLEVFHKAQPINRKEIIVKIPRVFGNKDMRQAVTDGVLREAGEKEYHGLCKLHAYMEKMKDDTLGAVKPIDYIRPINGIVMMRVSGETIDRQMNRASLRGISKSSERRSVLQSIERSARWLQVLHEMQTGIGAGSFDMNADLQIVNNILKKLRQYNIKQKFLAEVEHYVRRRFGTISSMVTAEDIVQIHGDYQARNIVVENKEGKVIPFDTSLDKIGVPYRDISKFVCSLRMTSSRFFFHRTLYDCGFVQKCEKEFLSGYFGAREMSRPLFNWYLLWAFLQKWNQLNKIFRSKRTWLPYEILSRTWINGIFEKEILGTME